MVESSFGKDSVRMGMKRAKSLDQNVIWDAADDGNVGGTAKSGRGLRGIPSSAKAI